MRRAAPTAPVAAEGDALLCDLLHPAARGRLVAFALRPPLQVHLPPPPHAMPHVKITRVVTMHPRCAIQAPLWDRLAVTSSNTVPCAKLNICASWASGDERETVCSRA